MIGSANSPVTLRALLDHVLVINMHFDEVKTASGIVLRSDDGKSHGVKPRWAQIYKIGPKQKDVEVGQWILVEHGRWTRKIKIHDHEGVKEVQRVDTAGIIGVSDEPPSDEDLIIGDSI
jgi:co-chaperonin GroES (HSP10)